jgi:hypothetical protein
MTVGLEGSGIVGIALETVAGTYTAPTKFFPVLSETLKYTQATTWRRPVRASVDVIGAVPGDVSCAGDITMEAFEDVVPYFLETGRTSVVKSGSVNFTYVFTGTAFAVPTKTMSITVVRNGIVYGYVGCVCQQWEFTVNAGLLQFKASVIGLNEAVQSVPTPAWVTTTPFGAGQYSIQIPTATQVFDTDTFTFGCNDNGAPQYRLKNNGQGAQFVSFGERALTFSLSRDFNDRTDYDAFKALTSQDITILASKGANNQITIEVPVAIKSDYTVNLSGQGNLLRAALTYEMPINSSGAAYTVTVQCQENI